MSLSKFVACICEGSAEQTVIRKRLDNDRLIFTYDDLIEEDVLRCRGAKDFEDRHLRKGFTKKITVYRILDSRRENFKLSKAYVEKVDVGVFLCKFYWDHIAIEFAVRVLKIFVK